MWCSPVTDQRTDRNNGGTRPGRAGRRGADGPWTSDGEPGSAGSPGGSSLAGSCPRPSAPPSAPRTCCRRESARWQALDRHVRRRGRAVRVRAGARPDVRGPRGVPAAGRGHRRRPQGDVRLPRQGRPAHGAAARGHRLGGPGVRRSTARPRRGRSGTSRPAFRYERPQAGRLPPAPPGRRRGARRRRPRPRRRGHRARRRPTSPRSACARWRLRASTRWARRDDRAALRRDAAAPGCAAGVGDLAADDREKVEAHPLRVLDSQAARRPRPWSADAPRIADVPRPTRPRPTSSGCQAGLGALGIAVRARAPPGPRARLLHAHHVRVPEPRRSTPPRPPSAAAAATTAWSRQLGGPPTPGIGFGSGIERMLLACDAEGVFAGAGAARSTCSWSTSPAATHARDLAARAAPRRAARRPGLRRPVDEGADEGRRPVGRPRGRDRRRAGGGRRHGHGARPARRASRTIVARDQVVDARPRASCEDQ